MKQFLPPVAILLFTVTAYAQNVGIGTSTPNYKLDVIGDVNVNSGSGFRVNGSAGAGQYLRGDGNRFAPSAIQPADVPAGSGHYIQNGTSLQTGDFRISGNGSAGTLSIGTATPNNSAVLDIVSGNKGVSFPNVPLQSVNDGATISLPKTGLVVYNTGPLSPNGLYINTGSPSVPSWQKLSDASGTVGSISVTAPITSTGGVNPTIGLGVVPVNLGGTGLTGVAAGQILIGNGSNTFINTTLTGTGNQVSIASTAGSIILSTPQDIATTSNVTFNKASFNTATDINSLEAGRSIKIGATSQTAGAAGVGSIRTNGTSMEYSDGTQWKNFTNGGTVTGSNGLTATPSGNNTDITLGGTLTSATTIATAGNNLNITGTGNVGIGVAAGTQKLTVGGAIELGNTATPVAGAIRWNSSTNDFESYDGQVWMSITGLINRSNNYMDDGF